MIYGRATFTGEEVQVTFSATGELTDYGVPRSPRFIEWTGVQIEEVVICGVTVNPRDLPAELVQALHDLSEEVEIETAD